MKTAIFYASLVFAATRAAGQEDYSQWAHNTGFTFNTTATGAGVSADQAGFPVLIRLDGGYAPVFAEAASGGADIRFSKADGVTRLPYEIERWDSLGQSAEIWVRVDTLKGDASTQAIRMFWGKPGALAKSSGAEVFDTSGGYAAVWHFGGTDSLGALSDATLNANHGINTGSQDSLGSVHGTRDTAGAIGRGRAFDTTTLTRVSVAHTPTLEITRQISLSVWINSRDWGPSGPLPNFGNRRILQKGDDGKAYALREVTDFDSLQFDLGGPAGPVAGASAIADPPLGEWHLLHATYDGTAAKLYLDGLPVAVKEDTGAILVSKSVMLIGGKPGSTFRRDFFHGGMDEIRIQSVARDSDWIKLEFANQRAAQTLVMPVPLGVRRRMAGTPADFRFRASGTGVLFTLPESADALRLSISDVRGRLIWSREAAPGKAGREMAWDGRGWDGGSARRGLYVVRLAPAKPGSAPLAARKLPFSP